MEPNNSLFSQVCSFANIHSAFKKARKGKKTKKDILFFNYYAEYNLIGIKNDLINNTYRHGKYKEFVVNDSKKRRIKAPTFRDRVVHHALCNIIEPIFDKSFIFDSYACRKNKGSHSAVWRLQSFLRKRKGIYCLTGDISKYFDSISHNILISLIERKIKDAGIMAVIKEVLQSSFSKREGVGIPIGNLTSQLFANIYLDSFDHFCKETMREVLYLRYMDDFLFLGKKHRLHAVARKSGHFLLSILGLNLNPIKVNVFPAGKGIDYLGYIIFADHILLRKKTVKRFLKKGGDFKAFSAYAKHADSYSLMKKLSNVLANSSNYT